MEVLGPNKALVVVKKFPSAAAAKIYLNAIRSNSQIFREYQPAEYQMFLISGNNYRKLVADKDVVPYMKFYSANYK